MTSVAPTVTPTQSVAPVSLGQLTGDALVQRLIKLERFADALAYQKYSADEMELQKQSKLYEQAKKEDRLHDAIEIKKVTTRLVRIFTV
jgi:hypothetical protein